MSEACTHAHTINNMKHKSNEEMSLLQAHGKTWDMQLKYFRYCVKHKLDQWVHTISDLDIEDWSSILNQHCTKLNCKILCRCTHELIQIRACKCDMELCNMLGAFLAHTKDP